MELIAFLGEDKANWGQVTALLNRGEWEKVVIVKNKKAENYPAKNCEIIEINSDKMIMELKKEIMEKIKNKISGLEVALSIASGTGKEHIALISALLSLPVGIKLVVYTKDGIEFGN
ncbi:MAG: hypothetical protein N3D20_01945 [Candidatus Pacearchaeota archaeon]|nr:hypothetical protein [Candidatus Pacearchaeota archaeon]